MRQTSVWKYFIAGISKNGTIALICFMLFAACKKDDKNTPPDTGGAYRIKSTLDGSDKKTFTYDNENRLTRMEYSGGYILLKYTNVEINAQAYFNNNDPDPNWNYKFARHNNQIVNVLRYMSNGGIGRDYIYEYDNSGALVFAVMRLYDFAGALSELHSYHFSYDDQANLSTVNYVRELKSPNGVTMQNSDSAAISMSYYSDKKFISWKQMGFEFFGKNTGGIQLTGLEIIPFSFLFQENIILSDKAVKIIETKKYKWDQLNTTWGPASSNTINYPETDYKYDDRGLLIKYKNISIEWETY